MSGCYCSLHCYISEKEKSRVEGEGIAAEEDVGRIVKAQRLWASQVYLMPFAVMDVAS